MRTVVKYLAAGHNLHSELRFSGWDASPGPVARRGRQCGVQVFPHRFRRHFSHTWLDRGGAEGDLMELNSWTSPQMLRRYGASARSARARRSYDRVMTGTP